MNVQEITANTRSSCATHGPTPTSLMSSSHLISSKVDAATTCLSKLCAVVSVSLVLPPTTFSVHSSVFPEHWERVFLSAEFGIAMSGDERGMGGVEASASCQGPEVSDKILFLPQALRHISALSLIP